MEVTLTAGQPHCSCPPRATWETQNSITAHMFFTTVEKMFAIGRYAFLSLCNCPLIIHSSRRWRRRDDCGHMDFSVPKERWAWRSKVWILSLICRRLLCSSPPHYSYTLGNGDWHSYPIRLQRWEHGCGPSSGLVGNPSQQAFISPCSVPDQHDCASGEWNKNT